MNFLARILRFIFWVLVVSWAVGLLRRAFSWMLTGAAPRTGVGAHQAETTRRLHRDPVCGVHVSEEISFALRENGETLHFCSEQCRAKYAASQGFAANG